MKKIITIIIASIVFSSCYSLKRTIKQSGANVNKINWPKDYEPETSRFFVHNEIDINASPERVWDILINAANWEDYYKGASDLILKDNTNGLLSGESVFTWKTMGLNFTSTIEEFEAPYRLSWESNRNNIRGYHAWLIIPTEQGCTLITSEAQHGFMTLPQKIFVPKKLKRLHDHWLEEIKIKSESLKP